MCISGNKIYSTSLAEAQTSPRPLMMHAYLHLSYLSHVVLNRETLHCYH